jgi:hypothetical protein
MELGVARAWGGHLAGPIAIWAVLCFLLLVSILIQVKRRAVMSGAKTLGMLSAAWIVHAATLWYTTIQLLGFFLFSALHLSTTAWKQEIFLMVDGSLRFALLSTTSFLLATIFSLYGALQKQPEKSVV